MVFNKLLILSLSIIFIVLFSLGSVSALDDISLADIDDSSDSNRTIENINNGGINNIDLDNTIINRPSNKLSNPLSSDNNSSFDNIQNLLDNAKEGDTIEINGIYYGDGKNIEINKELTLKGGLSGATLDAKFLSTILTIHSPNIIIENINFINSEYSGVECNASNVKFLNCTFNNCVGGELGSALIGRGNNISIINSKFSNNIANKSSCHKTDGAAIYMVGRYGKVINCTFTNNYGYNYETASSGGAIWWKGEDGSIIGSRFINNSATSKFGWTLHGEEQTYLAEGYGGAIWWTGNRGTIVDCNFSNNLAHSYGGAIYLQAVTNYSIINSNFFNNSAVGEGGVIFLNQNIFNLTILNCSFVNNSANGLEGVLTSYYPLGSAIYASSFVNDTVVSNCKFLNNNANNTCINNIYYLGSNLTVNNSFFENIRFEDLIISKDGIFNNNYWGANYNSSEEFKNNKVIKVNGEFISPNYWINIVKDSNPPEKFASYIDCKNMNVTAVVSADGRVGEYFKVTLRDSDGNALANRTINILFNGKVYNRVTDENGSAKLQINLGVAGGYTFAICFLGDNEYNASFAVAKITVVPQKLKVTLSNKVYKKISKNKILSVTVKTARGNPVSGLSIKFKVNGKIFTAKTDSKGIAKVNVSLTIKKNYSFTVYYIGGKQYASFSKNAYVKVI